jgi:hypothetical protein
LPVDYTAILFMLKTKDVLQIIEGQLESFSSSRISSEANQDRCIRHQAGSGGSKDGQKGQLSG